MTPARAGRELVGHSRNSEIGTPDELYERLDRRFLFNYDGAASTSNHRHGRYSTMSGTLGFGRGELEVLARRYNTTPAALRALDGLRFPWDGLRVYCNPPYESGAIDAFVNKAINWRNMADLIVMLLKYDPSTVAMQRLALYAHIEPLPRIQYQGMRTPATFASCIAIVRPDYSAARAPERLVVAR